MREDKKFYTLPTLGSIVPGWLLVVSRDHFLCSGQLVERDRSDLNDSVEAAVELVNQSFAPPTIFEHGPATPGTPVGCGVDHLHMHVAPLPGSLANTCTMLFASQWKEIDGMADLKQLHSMGIPYMLVREPDAAWKWAVPPSGIRQPLRRAIAHMVGRPDQFDYNHDFFEENAKQTLGELLLVA